MFECVAKPLDANIVAARATYIGGELRRNRLGDFNSRFMLQYFDRTNVLSRDVSLAAKHRQQPFWIGVLLAANVETKPHGGAGQSGLFSSLIFESGFGIPAGEDV